ncbi:cytochrome c oxidase subunit NDUFA4-like [Teleopsis dalmanni]|uniref:cytochrome c oxidase subunit NDUFA4-like n=1 Tax=Teleopsis dalmanni TaxID=139649 RepID=UPI0018CF6B6B|nr:cytochrome c oxidase subunit NDUFA4-like [Teleopsis dalmanni]XP_037932680.1 cytochrome c oxidase subunit NDUFA4-like [Teleopsis dalmanni]
MKGFTIGGIRKNPSLIPLYLCVTAGFGLAISYAVRVAIKNPDISWNRKDNPEPWQEYKNRQYKFYSPIRDYNQSETTTPRYEYNRKSHYE